MEDSALLLEVNLNERDSLLSTKQTLFSLAYIKNLNSEYGFATRNYNPANEMELHSIISPFRILVYSTYKPYIESV